jgi:hypothetical protein
MVVGHIVRHDRGAASWQRCDRGTHGNANGDRANARPPIHIDVDIHAFVTTAAINIDVDIDIPPSPAATIHIYIDINIPAPGCRARCSMRCRRCGMR